MSTKADDQGVKYTKPLTSDDEDSGSVQSYGRIHFSPNKRTRHEKILIVAVIILVILLILFLGLFIHERANDSECTCRTESSTKQLQENENTTQNPTTSINSTSTPAPSTSPTMPDYGNGPWEDVRLPKYFDPVHYNLSLTVDLVNLVFHGDVSVDVKVKNDTKYMFLHVNKLNMTSTPMLFNSDGSQISLDRHFFYQENQFYVMDPATELRKGDYNVKMRFTGKLENDLKGLYRSTYKNKDGKEITIATTQLQPTDARKVFPCFDEPSFKATFTVTLTRHKDLISITNMPKITSVPVANNMVADYYEKTVIMPTYLLAFIVCDFTYRESFAGKKNSSMKYYATTEQIDQVEFARSIGGRILKHFEDYFNISYPLPKADMIAIPDFAAGAMENWGLITYREAILLFKDGQSSEGNKERTTLVIAHELAHMWFGNLVTTEWWDDLWLNEGFASFVEYIGVDKVMPDWNMKDMFVIEDLARAFSLDALVTSHPILVPVNHPDEINEIFDSISYNKGASIIRMLQYFLGEDLFKTGLTNYLNKHSYDNAKTKDLWDALTKATIIAGKTIDVADIMDTWTLQMGYPVVNVTFDGDDIVLTQQRFLSNPLANQSNTKYISAYGYRWNIPFTIEIRERNSSSIINTTGNFPLTWMNFTSVKTTVQGRTWNHTQWVKANIGQTGFYRVNYPIKNWKALAEQLLFNHRVLSQGDRAGLIQDAFALADAKLLEFKYALDLTKYLDKEQDYIPWSAAYDSISDLMRILPKTEKIYRGLKEYRYQKMRPNLDRLGFEDNGTHLEKYLRIDAINTACSVKNETCLKITKDYFDKWIKNDTKSPVPADLRSVVYFYGMSQSGEKEWDIVFDRLQKTIVASERRKLMFGLAATPEPWLINRYLQYAFDNTKIKSQDTSAVLSYIANGNPIGRHFVWNYLKQVWPVILKRYGSGLGFAMSRFINGVASSFSTEWELGELEDLFKTYPQSGSGTRSRNQIIETVRSNIQWRIDNEQAIENWLDLVNNRK